MTVNLMNPSRSRIGTLAPMASYEQTYPDGSGIIGSERKDRAGTSVSLPEPASARVAVALGRKSGQPTKLDALRKALLTGAQLDEIPDPTWLVDGILPDQSTAALYGKPGIGKSFIALSWAMCVACGIPWLGRQVRHGPVLYVAAEGKRGLKRRRRAFLDHHGVEEPGRDHWLPKPVDVIDRESARALATIATDFEAVLTVIDTVARCIPGGDENSSQAMGAVLQAADWIRQESGGAVALVHHPPESADKLRGHGSLEGGIDTAVLVKNRSGTMVLSNTKQKDAPPFADIFAELCPARGSCVVIPGDPPPAQSSKQQGGHRAAMVALSAALPDGFRWGEWQKATGFSNGKFGRVSQDLLSQGLVKRGDDGRYRLTENGCGSADSESPAVAEAEPPPPPHSL